MIGSRGTHAFTELLKDGKFLHTLDISGNIMSKLLSLLIKIKYLNNCLVHTEI